MNPTPFGAFLYVGVHEAILLFQNQVFLRNSCMKSSYEQPDSAKTTTD